MPARSVILLESAVRLPLTLFCDFLLLQLVKLAYTVLNL